MLFKKNLIDKRALKKLEGVELPFGQLVSKTFKNLAKQGHKANAGTVEYKIEWDSDEIDENPKGQYKMELVYRLITYEEAELRDKEQVEKEKQDGTITFNDDPKEFHEKLQQMEQVTEARIRIARKGDGTSDFDAKVRGS